MNGSKFEQCPKYALVIHYSTGYGDLERLNTEAITTAIPNEAAELVHAVPSLLQTIDAAVLKLSATNQVVQLLFDEVMLNLSHILRHGLNRVVEQFDVSNLNIALLGLVGNVLETNYGKHKTISQEHLFL